MTIVYHEGFKDAALMQPPERVGATAINQTGRDGVSNSAMSLGFQQVATVNLPTAAAVCFIGWANAFAGTNAWALANVLMAWCTGTGTGRTQQCCLIINASGFFELRRTSPTGTLLGTSSGHTAITSTSSSVWYDLIGKCVLGASSNGSFELRLGGTTIMSLVGITNSGSTASVDSISWTGNTGGNSGNTQNNVFWDDLYVNDAVDATATQLVPNNDFLGDLRVACPLPTSDGDTTQFTPSTGSNHAALVDESPPNTTDYNGSGTDGQRDLYNVADLSGTVAAVLSVRVGLYATKSDAGSAALKTLVKENSVVTAGSSQGIGSTSYLPYWGPFRAVRPSDGAAWTVSDVNALQIGVEADL